MTDRGRGIWGDPDGARGVLEALGGPVAAPRDAPRVYRGRCENRAHPAIYVGRGSSRVLVAEADSGCNEEIAEGRNLLRFCAKCIAKYRAAMPVRRDREPGLGRYEPMPNLCHHGQKRGTCGACTW